MALSSDHPLYSLGYTELPGQSKPKKVLSTDKKPPLTKEETYLRRGEEKGEELVGATARQAGEGRKEVRERYEKVLDQPSRAATRIAEAGTAAMKRAKAARQGRGIAGGIAQRQDQQLAQDYATRAGDARQREYMQALQALDRQYRGAGKDILTASGQYGAIMSGSQPAPQVAPSTSLLPTYICTELNKRGLVTGVELFFMHILLIFGTIFKPAHTLFYLAHGAELVERMNERGAKWKYIKLGLFDISFGYVKKLQLFKSFDHYDMICRSLFEKYGFEEEVEEFDSSWSLHKMFESFSLMWRI